MNPFSNPFIRLGIGAFSNHSSAASSDTSPVNESEILYEETEDDAVTKFYKQHMVKSRTPGVSAHKVDTYMAETTTKSFRQRQQRKQEQRDTREDMRLHEESNQGYLVLMSIALALVVYVNISQIIHTRNHDAELKRIKLEKEKNSSEK